MKPRISMIALGVRDLAVSLDFYENGLGFPKVPSPPEVAFFNLNGSWLGLCSRESLAEDAQISPLGEGFSGFTLAHNVESEEEVCAIITQAQTAGARIIKTPQKTSWGGYSGYFQDPDGYLWEVAYNPFLWIGPKDIESS